MICCRTVPLLRFVSYWCWLRFCVGVGFGFDPMLVLWCRCVACRVCGVVMLCVVMCWCVVVVLFVLCC